MQPTDTYNAGSSTDRVLLTAVAAGSETAFRQLYDQWRDKVYNMAMHITRTEMDAEDMVQDVFLKIWMAREN